MAMLPPHLTPPEYHRLVAEDEKIKKLAKAELPASSIANVQAQSSTQAAVSPVSHVATAAVSSITEFFNMIERLNVNCPECPAVYKRRKGLVAHMSGQRSSPKGELYRCDRCCMVLHNACSFRSHTRIHDKVQPYVCPECDLVFRSSRDIFMKHVKKVCLHFSRFQSRQCPVCSTTLSHSEQAMVAHLENAHTALYYKYNSNTITFPTEKGFRTHNRAQHDQAATCEAFRKCPICNATEIDPQTLTSHLNQHVAKDGFGPLCFFRCLFCLPSFATRSDIIDHTRSAHPSEMITGQMCEVCGAVCNNGVTLYAHTKAQHEVFLTQLLSADTCKTACGAGQTGSAGSAEAEPPTAAPDAETGSQPGQKSLECDRCQMTLSDEKQLKRRMVKHRFLEEKRTGAKFSEGREKKKQRMDETSVASESVEIKSEHITDEAPATSKLDHLTPIRLASSSETVRRKNFHKIARKNIDYSRIASFNNKDNESTTGDEEKPTICDASLVDNLRVEGDVTYNCAKCEFSSTERTMFREHIAKHRQSESHQCLECGMSFVVLPSLKRHLFVIHRVRGFNRYKRETGLYVELPAVTEPDFDPDDSFLSRDVNRRRLSNADADSFDYHSLVAEDEQRQELEKAAVPASSNACVRALSRFHVTVEGLDTIEHIKVSCAKNQCINDDRKNLVAGRNVTSSSLHHDHLSASVTMMLHDTSGGRPVDRDSTLISYSTNFQSRMQRVDPGPAQPLRLMLTNDVSGVPVSQQVATSSTGTSDSAHRSSSAMMLAPSLISKALHPVLETSQPNQDLCSSTLQEDPPSGCSIDPQVSGLMNRRKRRQSPSSVIPVHVKEEKVDDSYETTTPQPAAAKIQVLDVSQGQKTVASRSQQPPQPSAVHPLARNPNRYLNPHQSIVTSSASTANALLLGRPRTVPAYRFAHFRTLVPKNVPTLGTVANGSNSLARFISSNTQTTARLKTLAFEGCRDEEVREDEQRQKRAKVEVTGCLQPRPRTQTAAVSCAAHIKAVAEQHFQSDVNQVDVYAL